MEDAEWFNMQNRSFQLATTYDLPRFVSQQGQGQIQIGRSTESVIINDAEFRLFDLNIDTRDDSFKITYDMDSPSNKSLTFFRTSSSFTISINRFNDFIFHTNDLTMSGKLKLSEVVDVSLDTSIGSTVEENKIIKKSFTYLLLVSAKGFQCFSYENGKYVISIHDNFSKSYGDATCCLQLTPFFALVGFRNGSIFSLDIKSNKKSTLKRWFKSDGPIISLNAVKYTGKVDNILVSIGKFPFQDLFLLNRRGVLICQFRTRFSNLSMNKELIKIVTDQDSTFIIYGKRLESNYDMFLVGTSSISDPVNLCWDWPESEEIIDILGYLKGDTLLFDRDNDRLRKRNVYNVTFHPIADYGFDSMRILTLVRSKAGSLSINEHRF